MCTLSSLSTAEQIVLNFSSGHPHTAKIPSNSLRWFTYSITLTIIMVQITGLKPLLHHLYHKMFES